MSKWFWKLTKQVSKTKLQVWTNPNNSYRGIHIKLLPVSKGWSKRSQQLMVIAQHNRKKIYILGFDYRGLNDGQKSINIYAPINIQDGATIKKVPRWCNVPRNWLRQTVVVKAHKEIQFIRVIAPDNYCPDELNKLENYSTTVDESQKQFVLFLIPPNVLFGVFTHIFPISKYNDSRTQVKHL